MAQSQALDHDTVPVVEDDSDVMLPIPYEVGTRLEVVFEDKYLSLKFF